MKLKKIKKNSQILFKCNEKYISEQNYRILKGGANSADNIRDKPKILIHSFFWPIKLLELKFASFDGEMDIRFMNMNPLSRLIYDLNMPYTYTRFAAFNPISSSYRQFKKSDLVSDSTELKQDSEYVNDYDYGLIIEYLLKYYEYTESAINFDELYSIINDIIINKKCQITPILNLPFKSAAQSAVAFNQPKILQLIWDHSELNQLTIPGELEHYFLCILFQRVRFTDVNTTDNIRNQNWADLYSLKQNLNYKNIYNIFNEDWFKMIYPTFDRANGTSESFNNYTPSPFDTSILNILEKRYLSESEECWVPNIFYIKLRKVVLEVETKVIEFFNKGDRCIEFFTYYITERSGAYQASYRDKNNIHMGLVLYDLYKYKVFSRKIICDRKIANYKRLILINKRFTKLNLETRPMKFIHEFIAY